MCGIVGIVGTSPVNQRLYDALTCPKTLIRFTAAEGAGDHCEASARSVYFQRAYDWLDGIFGVR